MWWSVIRQEGGRPRGSRYFNTTLDRRGKAAQCTEVCLDGLMHTVPGRALGDNFATGSDSMTTTALRQLTQNCEKHNTSLGPKLGRRKKKNKDGLKSSGYI